MLSKKTAPLHRAVLSPRSPIRVSSVFQGGDGIGFDMGYICCNTNCLQVLAPTYILIYSCSNVPVTYAQLAVLDPCCGTNWSVVFNPPSGTFFDRGKASLVNWTVTDCAGSNVSGSFWVSVYCSNCCDGPITNYNVTVVQGSNYLADCLCQGTSNQLSEVLPSVPVGTEVYFWDAAAGQFAPVDTFTGTGWQNGIEPMYPGEGFLLVSFASQYSLTIYGSEPDCPTGCSPLTCSSPTALVGDYGLNPESFCDLFCCPPIAGTGVKVWDPTSQSFVNYTYIAGWTPQDPPPLPVGYSEFVSVNCPIINILQSDTTSMLTWPAGQNWHLQVQTNLLSPNGWTTLTGVPDGNYNILVDPTRPAMFYRLTYP